MKKILYLTLSILPIIFYGQQAGINTDNPKQTLDIEGTLGISQLGESPKKLPNGKPEFKVSPLYWNKNKSSNKEDQGKIVASSADLKPFTKVRYNFYIKNPDEDWINGVDLGIDATKYTVVLMQYRLTNNTNDNEDETENDATYLRVLYTKQDGNPGTPISTSRVYLDYGGSRGYLTENNTSRNRLNDASLIIGAPLVYLYNKDNKWYFYADYPATGPVSFNYAHYGEDYKKLDTSKNPIRSGVNYVWKVDFLIIKNDLINNIGEITIQERKDSNNKSISTNIDDVKNRLGTTIAKP